MNMLKKGPDLKLSNVKVPAFLQDVYYDLRERRLLPLVVLLLVAIVAVPILLSKGSEFEPVTPAVSPGTNASESNLIFAKATPGLREYKRRFQGRSAHNPFVQKFEESEGEAGSGSEAPSEATIEESGSGGSESVPSSGSGGSEPVPSEGGGNGAPTEEPSQSALVYYSWAVDVRISTGSAQNGTKPQSTVRRNLPEYTSLPSKKVPALTFIGVTKDEKRALMLVSDKVTGLFGEGVCVQGTERCQLVAIEPDFPLTVVYGADSRTYHIELRKIRLVRSDKLNQAPLGKHGKHGGKDESRGRAKASSATQQPIEPASADVSPDQLIAGQ